MLEVGRLVKELIVVVRVGSEVILKYVNVGIEKRNKIL